MKLTPSDQEIIKMWRKDPVRFVRDNFHVEPDLWQVGALKGFVSRDYDMIRISLQACAGPGKSAVLAWCGWLFLSCYGEEGEHPKGAAVSVTEENLKDNLWVELSKWQQKSPFLSKYFKWSKSRIFAVDHPETWFLSARSYPKSADKETIGKTLSGIHSKYVLFIIDESGDIPPEIGKAAEQAVGEGVERGGFIKIMQAGNPISRDGMLYAASMSNKWHVIRITGDPDDPNRSPRINKQWAQDMVEEYGREDVWVASYILGHFPTGTMDSLLSVMEVEKAMERHYRESDYGYSQKRLGADIARSGMDSTVLFPRQGLAAHQYITLRGKNGPEVAARIMQAQRKWNQERVFIDDTGGFGSSVIDSLVLAGENPTGIHFASKAIDSERYFNRRSEMWLEMAEWVKRGGALPKCNVLKKELTSVKYFLRKGKLALEEKAEVKKRLGFSPDKADALALTFAEPDTRAKGQFDDLLGNKGFKSEYNLLED